MAGKDTSTATVKGQKFPSLQFENAPNLGSSSSDVTWAAARSGTIDVSGLGIPGHLDGASAKITGDQLYQILNAYANNSQLDPNGTWAGVRSILTRTQKGYTTKDLNYAFTTADKNALQNFITGLYNVNKTSSTPIPFVSYLNQKQTEAKKNGLSFASNSLATPSTVPSTAELAKTAQTTFATVLGRSATPKEEAMFAKQFQDMVLAYDNAKKSGKGESTFAQPANPIDFAPSGANLGVSGITSAPTTTAKVSTATTGLTTPPSASVAASNFAANLNPAEASAQAASDGLGQFLSMLKGA